MPEAPEGGGKIKPIAHRYAKYTPTSSIVTALPLERSSLVQRSSLSSTRTVLVSSNSGACALVGRSAVTKWYSGKLRQVLFKLSLWTGE